jgi:hypothetical protein
MPTPSVVTLESLTKLAPRRRHHERGQSGGVLPRVLVEAQPDVVLLAALAVEAHLLAADHGAERTRHRVHAHPEVRGLLAVDAHLDLGLAQGLGGVQVHEAALGLELTDDVAREQLEAA